MRPSRSYPQSSSSHMLYARATAGSPSRSSFSISSTPRPRLGRIQANSTPWSSSAFTRASRSWYSGWRRCGSPRISRRERPSGFSRAEVAVERSRPPDRVVRGVRDELEQLAADDERAAAIHVDPAHRAAVLAVEVAGERILRLVVVLVGVEQPVVDRRHSRSVAILDMTVKFVRQAAAIRRSPGAAPAGGQRAVDRARCAAHGSTRTGDRAPSLDGRTGGGRARV